jgi:HD-like signal output (HDOD) protein
LSTIDSALKELLVADQRYTSQIAEIIRRDPSLTARLLRLVNSVYYGVSQRITNIEEAVFYLGVRQIRQLAMVTPIIEDFQKLAGNRAYPWREFWRHCIGTALMTREVIAITWPD